jgi:hypothetical protein
VETEGVAEGNGPYPGISKSRRAAWLLIGNGTENPAVAPDVCLGERWWWRTQVTVLGLLTTAWKGHRLVRNGMINIMFAHRSESESIF